MCRPFDKILLQAEQRSICVGTTIGRPLGRSVFPYRTFSIYETPVILRYVINAVPYN